MTPPPGDHPIAVLHARNATLPLGADETTAEADGYALVTGDGAHHAATTLTTAHTTWYADTGPGLHPAALAAALAPHLARSPLVICPASPDGRDLAPRLAAALATPLLTAAARLRYDPATRTVHAELTRNGGRTTIDAHAPRATATLLPAPGHTPAPPTRTGPAPLTLTHHPAPADPHTTRTTEPEPHTTDLAEAPRVAAGGAGLAPPGTPPHRARTTFDRLTRVATRLGAATGATRVATDAGWAHPDRQIGTTGATLDPDLYLAFGISGAPQHTGGIGTPRHIISVNTDPACPMTTMADLALVTDAADLLAELDRRLTPDTTQGPP